MAVNGDRIGDVNSSLTPSDGPSFVIKVGSAGLRVFCMRTEIKIRPLSCVRKGVD